MIWAAPTIIIGNLTQMHWLIIVGCLMTIPFAIVGLAGFVWTLILDLTRK